MNIYTDLHNDTIGMNDSEIDYMHIWSRLVDVQFSSSKIYKCHRGGISCIASSARKNEQLKEGERK